MVQIVLGRHGQCTLNADNRLNGHLPSDLTPLGVRQATRKAECLRVLHARYPIDAVYTSDLPRARQTGSIICRMLDLVPPEILPGMRERSLGEMTGMTVPEARAMAAPELLIRTPFVSYIDEGYGFESFAQATERARQAVEELRRRHQGGTVLCIAHGDINVAVVAAVTGRPMRELIQEIYFGHFTHALIRDDNSVRIHTCEANAA